MKALTLFTCLLALVVIGLGAYTRLKDAGLGCPDWPGCYGHLVVPQDADSLAKATQHFQQTVEPQKAWLEMIHRYVAGTLGLCILALAFLGLKTKNQQGKRFLFPLLIVAVVIFQALLGMWTVTLKLSPPIILLHLLGGMTTLGLLWWQYLALTCPRMPTQKTSLLGWSILIFGILILQIALGALTSANYAALICPDFPYCQGQWLPTLNFMHFFTTHIHQENNALITMHMSHRIGAIIAALSIGTLALTVLLKTRITILRITAAFILLLLAIQLTLGILNIILLLPIATALTHNLIAALLVAAMLTLIFFSPLYERGRRK